METIKLTIPNMKSTHCQMTVSNTVDALGAKVISVLPGGIEIDLGVAYPAKPSWLPWRRRATAWVEQPIDRKPPRRRKWHYSNGVSS